MSFYNGRSFTKYGSIVLLKDKTEKYILSAFEKCITTFNIPTTLQTDNGTELEKYSKKFYLKEIFNIFLELLIVSNSRVH